MSKLALHIQHFKKGAIRGIAAHNVYKRGAKDEHSNQEIDPSRSSENLRLIEPEQSFYQAVKARVEGATGRVTANSVWVSEWIIYPPEHLQNPATADKNEVKKFYEDVHQWMLDHGYIIEMSTVHFDETTVHGHIDTVPMTEDGRLSRKDIYTRASMNNIHTDLAKHLQERGWDIQRGDSTEGKQVKSKSVVEYKKQAEAEKLQLIKEIEVLKADISRITAVLTPEQIEAIEKERTLFGSVKVPQRDYEALKRTALTAEKAVSERDQAIVERDQANERAERYFEDANKQLNYALNYNNQLLQKELAKSPSAEMQMENRSLKLDNQVLNDRLNEEKRRRKKAEEEALKLQQALKEADRLYAEKLYEAAASKWAIYDVLKGTSFKKEALREAKDASFDIIIYKLDQKIEAFEKVGTAPTSENIKAYESMLGSLNHHISIYTRLGRNVDELEAIREFYAEEGRAIPEGLERAYRDRSEDLSHMTVTYRGHFEEMMELRDKVRSELIEMNAAYKRMHGRSAQERRLEQKRKTKEREIGD